MKITDSIHALKIPFEIPGTGFWREVYIYFIIQDEITIIDSGVAGSEKSIFEYLEKLGRKPEEITTLLITHAHPDHIGAAQAIQNRTGCRIGAHKNAIPWIENIELQNQERPVPGFFEMVGGSAKVDFTLNEEEVLSLGGTRLHLFDTPGHSHDSITFWEETEQVLITGDLIPQWGDLPMYDNYAELRTSLRFILQFEKITWLLSSWCDPIAGDDSAKRSIREGLEYIETIDREILNITARDIQKEGSELCREVVTNLKLPEYLVNPMVAKSFASHLIQ